MRSWLSMLILCAARLVQGGEDASALAAAGVREFRAAYAVWSGEGFAAAAEKFQQAGAQAPTCGLYFYWQGTAHFHRMLQLQTLPAAETNEAAAEVAREAALAALSTAVDLNERDAESHALLGTLLGMKIDGNWLRALRYGPRVQKHANQALKFGPDNPRVRYLLGVGHFHTATKAAAQREALASLLAAEELFQAEAQRERESLDPCWGHSSCLTFIGRSYERLGQRAKAAEYFRKALALHPADLIAKEGLARVTTTN